MTKVTFFGIMPALTLAFGLVLAGCSNGTAGPGALPEEVIGLDASLNGTWVPQDPDMTEKIIFNFNNGAFEIHDAKGNVISKGTYTTNGGDIVFTETAINGSKLNNNQFSQTITGLDDEKLYDVKTVLKGQGISEKEIEAFIAAECVHPYSYTVNRTTMTWTDYASDVTTFTKQ